MKIILYLFRCLFFMLILSFFSGGIASAYNPDVDAKGENLNVNLGEVILSIPKKYFLILPIHENKDNPEAVSFSLLVLLPNFEPKSLSNIAEFSELGWGRKINIYVSYGYNRLTGKKLFDRIWSIYGKNGVVSSDFGYKNFGDHYKDEYLPGKNIAGHDRFFHGSTENPTDYVECARIGSVNSPSCERIILVGRDLVASYHLSRDFLGNIPAIDSSVVVFLNKFLISGPRLEILE